MRRKNKLNKHWTVLMFIFTLHCSLFMNHAVAQIGTWRAFMSYYEPQQIVKGGNHLFVRASNDLYSYNLNDQSIITYDKVNGLSDTYITHIAWNDQAQRLIIVYQNQNIDLMDASGEVVNISALYSKSIAGDKTVHDVFINGPYAYLATGFGVVKINMVRAEVSESCILNRNITNVGVDGTTLYAKARDTFTNIPYNTDNSTLATGTVVYDVVTARNDKGEATKKTVIIEAFFQIENNQNFIDPNKWVLTANVPAGIFDKDLTDWNNHLETVKTLQPGGPKYNYFAMMRFKNNQLYTCGGGYNPANLIDTETPATIQILNGSEWNILNDDVKGNFAGTEPDKWQYVCMLSVDADPLDQNHIFGGSRTGLYEFRDGQPINYFNKDNSILKPATSSNRYVLVLSVKYDANGNLWLLQSTTTDNAIVEITKDGEWISHYQDKLMNNGKSLNSLKSLFFDNEGMMWFVNTHHIKPAIICYNPKTDEIIQFIDDFSNQDGISTANCKPLCCTEDLDGNIWIGTTTGPYMIEKDNRYVTGTNLTQVKVPRNDGSNYADYLLANVKTTSIAVDGANRKWFGTEGAGAYLISADNMEQLQNFTAENSKMISNFIESIAINNETGEVFFGTDMGLCSYISDATTAQPTMVKENVYAYPNPVVKDYDGLITIVGLSMDADVKILSTNGKLIAQGRSNGGTFTWNGRDNQGRRVATGIYMVATATSDGNKGTVCKIAVIN